MKDFSYSIECSEAMMESATTMAEASKEKSGVGDIPISMSDKQGLTFSLVGPDGEFIFKFFFLNDIVLAGFERGMYKMVQEADNEN